MRCQHAVVFLVGRSRSYLLGIQRTGWALMRAQPTRAAATTAAVCSLSKVVEGRLTGWGICDWVVHRVRPR